MSLPELATKFEGYGEFVILDRRSVKDTYGGTSTVWVEGAHIFATVVLDDSIEARTAAAQGVTGIYNVLIQKNVHLPWHTVIRRVSDGAIYRITSKDEKTTPSTSAIDMRHLHAEEWELPTDPNGDKNGQ